MPCVSRAEYPCVFSSSFFFIFSSFHLFWCGMTLRIRTKLPIFPHSVFPPLFSEVSAFNNRLAFVTFVNVIFSFRRLHFFCTLCNNSTQIGVAEGADSHFLRIFFAPPIQPHHKCVRLFRLLCFFLSKQSHHSLGLYPLCARWRGYSECRTTWLGSTPVYRSYKVHYTRGLCISNQRSLFDTLHRYPPFILSCSTSSPTHTPLPYTSIFSKKNHFFKLHCSPYTSSPYTPSPSRHLPLPFTQPLIEGDTTPCPIHNLPPPQPPPLPPPLDL